MPLTADEEPTDLAVGHNVNPAAAGPALEFVRAKLLTHKNIHCAPGFCFVGSIGPPDAVTNKGSGAKKLGETSQLVIGIPTDVFTAAAALEELCFDSGERTLVSCSY